MTESPAIMAVGVRDELSNAWDAMGSWGAAIRGRAKWGARGLKVTI